MEQNREDLDQLRKLEQDLLDSLADVRTRIATLDAKSLGDLRIYAAVMKRGADIVRRIRELQDRRAGTAKAA